MSQREADALTDIASAASFRQENFACLPAFFGLTGEFFRQTTHIYMCEIQMDAPKSRNFFQTDATSRREVVIVRPTGAAVYTKFFL
jgi:hypothetical protein